MIIEKRLKFTVVVLLLLYVVRASAEESPVTIGTYTTIQSKILNETRSLSISLPVRYDLNSLDRYPLIILLDGPSHFQHTTATAKYLARLGHMPDAVIVGIANTNRTRDLTPKSNVPEEQEQHSVQGGADNFLKFISEELIPWVDRKYRTRPYRILIGHSYGGLFAIHSLITKPDVFNAYIAISPSLQWNDQAIVKRAEEFFSNEISMYKDLFITVGNEDGALLGGIRKFSGVLDEYTPKNFRWDFRRLPDETHSSVPLRSTVYGLQAIFKGWNPDATALYDSGGMKAIEESVHSWDERLGYKRKFPWGIAREPFAQFWKDKRYEKILTFYDDLPEGSAVPHQILEYYAKELMKQNVEKVGVGLYQRLIAISPGNKSARRELSLRGIKFRVPDVNVQPTVLEKYVGEYLIQPNYKITITLEGDKLFAKSTDFPKMHAVAMSNKRFYFVGADAQIEFLNDTKGLVTKLNTYRYGDTNTALKL